MTGKKSFIIVLLLTLILAFALSTGVSANVTPKGDANYTLFYNSSNGKMYTDQGMTKTYTNQTDKWSAAYDSKIHSYVLTLNNFKFYTSTQTALSLPYDTVIQLQAGSKNEIASVFLGVSNTYGILANGTLTIRSTGDGSGALSTYSGTAAGIDGHHSCGMRILGNLQFISGHLFAYGGADNLSTGMETVSMDFYNGEIGVLGHHQGLVFIESQSGSNYLNYVAGTAIYGGSDAVTRNRLDIVANSPNIKEEIAYPSIDIINLYPDIPYNAWYAQPIFYLIDNNIVTGYANSDGLSYQIRPGNPITRAEFVTILARLFESEADLEQYAGHYAFTDVPSWASKYVGWATEAGFVNGIDEDSFGSNRNITREQMAAILYRIVVESGMTPNSTNPAIQFTDQDSIAGYAKDAVAAMQQDNVINGYSNGDGTFRFNPKGQATRAEAFTMIYNFLHAFAK